jgi:hypothetical protein
MSPTLRGGRLDPKLMTLLWEVAETLGGRALLEEVSHWDLPLEAVWCLAPSCLFALLPGHHKASIFAPAHPLAIMFRLTMAQKQWN